ncbi:Uncharacterised protein [Mycobacteroides abscessus subsp. abscessus]|nr:Uncharacterised protein [Mycobacteroides abscessus subsp. abscessus]
MVLEEAVESTEPMPSSLVTSATVTSPPGRMSSSTPMGAVSTGAASRVPSTSVDRSRLPGPVAPRSIRGTIR